MRSDHRPYARAALAVALLVATSGCATMDYSYSEVRSSYPSIARKLDGVFIDLTPECQPGREMRRTVDARSSAEYDQRSDEVLEDHQINRTSKCQ